MANVKVFEDKQTERQAKSYMPLIYQYGGTKKNNHIHCNLPGATYKRLQASKSGTSMTWFI